LTEYNFLNIPNEEIYISLFEIISGEFFQIDNYSIRETNEHFCLVGYKFEFSFNLEYYNDIC
jgi:hypothetical protein